MKQQHYSLILVPSTNHALRAEKMLERVDIRCKLIPVPRHISSECGVCIRVLPSDLDRTREVLRDALVDIQGIHSI